MTGLSKRDAEILKYAGRGESPEQIAARWPGTPPAKVASEIDRLLKSQDWLSELQATKLLLLSLWEYKGALEDWAKSGDEKLGRLYLQTVIQLLDRLEAQRQRVDADIDRVQVAQAKAFTDIIDRAFYVALDRLEQRIEIPREALEAEFQDAILFVAGELDAQERKEA